MAVGLSDGTSYADSADWFAASVDKRTDKQRSDQQEINSNSQSGDFESRFGATYASTMPLQASTELTGALKQTGSTKVPRKSENIEDRRNDTPIDTMAWPRPDGVLQLPNKFETGQGTLIDFDADKDFAPVPTYNPLGHNLGSLPIVDVTDRDIDTGINVAMSAGPGTMVGVRSIGNLTGAAKGEALSNLGHAQVLEANGIHPDDIVKQTGFSRGAEGRWKTELDDSVSKFDPKWHEGVPIQAEPVTKSIFEQTPFNPDLGMKVGKLSEVLDHPELYKSIPALKDIKVIRDPGYPADGAVYQKGSGPGGLEGAQIRMGTEAAESHGILMHEVQHAIQEYEGFAKGGAPRTDVRYLKYTPDVEALKPEMEAIIKKAKDPESIWTVKDVERYKYLAKVSKKYEEYTKTAYAQASEYYHRLAGEVESKNVDARLLMTEVERKRTPPRWTEDTPRSKQVIKDIPVSTTAYGIVDKGRYIKP